MLGALSSPSELGLVGGVALGAAAAAAGIAYRMRPTGRREFNGLPHPADPDLQPVLEEFGLHELVERVRASRLVGVARERAREQLVSGLAGSGWFVERDLYLDGAPVPFVLWGPAAYAILPNNGWSKDDLPSFEGMVTDLQGLISPSGRSAAGIFYSPFVDQPPGLQHRTTSGLEIWSIGGIEQLRAFLEDRHGERPASERLDLYRQGTLAAPSAPPAPAESAPPAAEQAQGPPAGSAQSPSVHPHAAGVANAGRLHRGAPRRRRPD